MSAALLPAAPLLAAIDGRGGPAAAGVRPHSALERAYCRARRAGVLTRNAADRLAVELLGEHPAMLWGDAWFKA